MFGRLPRRLARESNHYALVDGIPFRLPVRARRLQALMAAFPVDREAAAALLPDKDIRVARLWRNALFVVTVVNYEDTVIGRYIEYSLALACAHRDSDPPPLLPFLFRDHYQFGQYVYDLPVSTEISVKGGKGIWGMPKHQANLNFVVGDNAVSSQYDEDGLLAAYAEVSPLPKFRVPVTMGASNYCQFRGMLMKSTVYFKGSGHIAFGRRARARIEFGDHPRVRPLKELGIRSNPVFTLFLPDAHGVLDDHAESWFLEFDQQPSAAPEGMESVVGLGLGQEWLPPPTAPH